MSSDKDWTEEAKEKVKDNPEALAERYLIDLTEQILLYMEENDITKSVLADRMDVSRGYISKLFSDNSNLTLLTLAKISKALDIGWIFKRTSTESAYPIAPHYWDELVGKGEERLTKHVPEDETVDKPDVEDPYLVTAANEGSTGNMEAIKLACLT